MTMNYATPDLALVGAGYWGRNLARNFQLLGALHTLCDSSAEILSSYGAEYAGVCKMQSFDEVLKNPAVRKVAVAAPAVLHHSLARSALLAGKDVLVEKPLCLNATDAEDLIAIAQERGAVLMVGHLLQYHPYVRELQRLVTTGVLGRIQYITSNRLNLGKIRQEENSLWSFAPHDISVILSLTGNRLPEHVRCVGESYLTPRVADTTLTSFRFPEGVRAHVYVSWLNPFKEQKLTVVGSRAMAVFDDTKPWDKKLLLHCDYLTWAEGRMPAPNKAPGTAVTVPEEEPLRAECLHFLECCATRARPRSDGAEGLRVLRVLKAAQASLERDGDAVVVSGVAPAYFAHPSAVIDPKAVIGAGCKIWHFSHVMAGAELGVNCNLGQNVVVSPGVRLGANVKVQNNVSIYSGTIVEQDVFLGPSCVLTNVSNPRAEIKRQGLYENTLIRRGASIGANATIVCGTTLGRYCFIAAGAVVTRDVPDYGLMIGAPARRVGWISRHGHRLSPGKEGIMVCPESGFRYKEVQPKIVRCLDHEENESLPAAAAIAMRSYREVKELRERDNA